MRARHPANCRPLWDNWASCESKFHSPRQLLPSNGLEPIRSSCWSTLTSDHRMSVLGTRRTPGISRNWKHHRAGEDSSGVATLCVMNGSTESRGGPILRRDSLILFASESKMIYECWRRPMRKYRSLITRNCSVRAPQCFPSRPRFPRWQPCT